ncbi:hypothetical protein DFJ73DRAFT_843314, partial [Zopfochytrium polystomum]
MLVLGTRGDVAPAAALAQQLLALFQSRRRRRHSHRLNHDADPDHDGLPMVALRVATHADLHFLFPPAVETLAVGTLSYGALQHPAAAAVDPTRSGTSVPAATLVAAAAGSAAIVFNLFCIEGYSIAERLGVPAVAFSTFYAPDFGMPRGFAAALACALSDSNNGDGQDDGGGDANGVEEGTSDDDNEHNETDRAAPAPKRQRLRRSPGRSTVAADTTTACSATSQSLRADVRHWMWRLLLSDHGEAFREAVLGLPAMPPFFPNGGSEGGNGEWMNGGRVPLLYAVDPAVLAWAVRDHDSDGIVDGDVDNNGGTIDAGGRLPEGVIVTGQWCRQEDDDDEDGSAGGGGDALA